MDRRVTEADLLSALAASLQGAEPDDAKTLKELAVETSLTEKKVRAALHVLHAQRRLVVHRVHRVGLDGRNALVPAYTILPAA